MNKTENIMADSLSEWIANAAALMGWSPSTTSPSSFTRIRSETQISEKCIDSGLSQKWSVRMGSRTEMCPATPSSAKPRSAKLRWGKRESQRMFYPLR